MAKGQRNKKKNRYSGSSFDDFLKEEGIYEEVKTLAQKELASERYKHDRAGSSIPFFIEENSR